MTGQEQSGRLRGGGRCRAPSVRWYCCSSSAALASSQSRSPAVTTSLLSRSTRSDPRRLAAGSETSGGGNACSRRSRCPSVAASRPVVPVVVTYRQNVATWSVTTTGWSTSRGSVAGNSWPRSHRVLGSRLHTVWARLHDRGGELRPRSGQCDDLFADHVRSRYLRRASK